MLLKNRTIHFACHLLWWPFVWRLLSTDGDNNIESAHFHSYTIQASFVLYVMCVSWWSRADNRRSKMTVILFFLNAGSCCNKNGLELFFFEMKSHRPASATVLSTTILFAFSLFLFLMHSKASVTVYVYLIYGRRWQRDGSSRSSVSPTQRNWTSGSYYPAIAISVERTIGGSDCERIHPVANAAQSDIYIQMGHSIEKYIHNRGAFFYTWIDGNKTADEEISLCPALKVLLFF